PSEACANRSYIAIRPALCMDGGKAVTIPEAGAGPGYGIDVKEQLTETPPAYHRGRRDSQRVCFCASPASAGPSAAGLLTSFSTFVAIDRIRIRLSLKKDMRMTLK